MNATNGWPTVPLGEVLTHRKEFVQIDDLTRYKRCRVQLHAQGVVLRDEVEGAMIKTKSQQVCKADEFLVAEIDAKMGGFGLVPVELEGAVVSSHYFLFVSNVSRLDPRFLGYYSKTPQFREQVAARGTTNYAAIRPAHVLAYTLPLPPPDEQQRIVAKIDRLAAKVDEVQTLVRQCDSISDGLLMSAYHEIADAAPRKPLRDVAPLIRRPAVVDPHSEYPQVSVRSFGRGTFHNPPLQGSEITWQKPYLVKNGDILVSNIKAWEGAMAVAGPDDDGRFGSHRYLTFVPVDGVATANFLCFHLLSPEGLYQVGEASPGSADRNRTLSSNKMLEIPVPVPSYEKQQWFDELLSKISAARNVRKEAATVRDAMLPSILDRAFKGAL
jgi:type I restriction enzyme S subunit